MQALFCLGWGRVFPLLGWLEWTFFIRQKQAERRSTPPGPHAASHRQRSVMPRDDSMRDPQPQPGPMHFLGGVEGFEDALSHFF